MPVYP